MTTTATPAPRRAFQNQPLQDFSRSATRNQMARALARARAGFGSFYPVCIGGQELGGERLVSHNPADVGTVVGEAGCGGAREADRAVETAKAAFPAWRRVPAAERAAAVGRLAARLRGKWNEFAAMLVFEAGKPWREADAEVAEAIDFCEYYAGQMLELDRRRPRNVPGESNFTHYTPRGVCAVISPWNFPLAILCGMTAAPLVGGNTVVLKPAEQTPVVAGMFFRELAAVGLPAGVVNFLPGRGEEAGAALVRHPDTATVNFTGSAAVAAEICRAAAELRPRQEQFKRVVAETGGKNAIIVDADADLDEAVCGVLASGFGYAGQKCSACSRVIVLRPAAAEFEARIGAAAAGWSVGPPEDPAYAIGPVIDADAKERLCAAIARGKASAECLFAGDAGPHADRGHYVAPHVFRGVDPGAELAQAELFGPVLAILQADDLDHALAIANGTSYALTGGVYSRNPRTVERAVAEFEVGNLYVNRKITGAEVDRQPFGGMKLSGVGGKAGGPDYLPQFLYPRTVCENTVRRGFAPPT